MEVGSTSTLGSLHSKWRLWKQDRSSGAKGLKEKCTMCSNSLRLYMGCYRGSFCVMDHKLDLGVTIHQLKQDGFLPLCKMILKNGSSGKDPFLAYP